MAPNRDVAPFGQVAGSWGPGATGRRRVLVVISGLLVAAMSWVVLYLRIWLPGLETGFKDPRHYLASAVQLASVGRLELLGLRLEPVRLVSEPLASFPPLTSWALAAFVATGAAIERAPTLLSLTVWPLLLGSIALLTHRLCRDAVLALLAVGIATITWPFLNVYTKVSSEILFLPLLVLATAVFTGLPDRERRVSGSLILGSLLTTLLVLARYTGIFFYLPLLVWWVWHRARQRQIRRLVPELAILALPGLVLVSWMARNVALTGHLFGPTLMSETLDVGYSHIVRSFGTHATWLVLPAVRPGPVLRAHGIGGVFLVSALATASGILLWHAWRRSGFRLPSSPLLPFLATYVGFLALAPSFMRMQGMTERYMAVVLALAQPFLIARLAGAPRTWARAFLVAFLAVQLGLVLALSAATGGLGLWIQTKPLRATDLGGRPANQMHHLLAGTPAWWVHRPPRLHDLERHLPELYGIVAGLDADTPIISNAPELFSTRRLLPASNVLPLWLERVGCHPPFPVAAVVVDWDRWSRGGPLARNELPAERLRELVEDRCPEARRFETPYGTLFVLSPPSLIGSGPRGPAGTRKELS